MDPLEVEKKTFQKLSAYQALHLSLKNTFSADATVFGLQPNILLVNNT